MTAVDVDRDTAHDAAAAELAKPIYPGKSPSEQLSEWVNDLLYRLVAKGSQVPGGWFTLTILALIAVAMLVVAARVARRTMRSHHREQHLVTDVLHAADHRALAEHAAAQQDWSAAIRHLLRAIARELEEDGALDPVPSRTADELAAAAGEVLPDFAAELRFAATVFNEVSYGHRRGTESGYLRMADLENRVRRRTVAVS